MDMDGKIGGRAMRGRLGVFLEKGVSTLFAERGNGWARSVGWENEHESREP
jgi:hypothetical protein